MLSAFFATIFLICSFGIQGPDKVYHYALLETRTIYSSDVCVGIHSWRMDINYVNAASKEKYISLHVNSAIKVLFLTLSNKLPWLEDIAGALKLTYDITISDIAFILWSAC